MTSTNDRDMAETITKPILRWAGGKSRLVPHLIDHLPETWERYFEPMIGGGAFFFSLEPKQAVLADINSELINFYQELRDRAEELIVRLLSLKADEDTYYKYRASDPDEDLDRAIRFAYLNRLCWNGLYRVNLNGEFNVPFGGRVPETLWKKEDLEAASQRLASAELSSCSYEDILDQVESDDFVFLDPPYPRGSNNKLGFNRYSLERFEIEDHETLGNWVEKLTDRGVKVMITLSDTTDLRTCYPNSLNATTITSTSLFSCNGETRRKVSEVILRNYP